MSPTGVVIISALLIFILAILYRISGQLEEITNRLDDALRKDEAGEEEN